MSDIIWGFDERGGISNISWDIEYQLRYRISAGISISNISRWGISDISWSFAPVQMEGTSNMSWSHWDIEYRISAGVRSWGISDFTWSFVIEYQPDFNSCEAGSGYRI